MLHPDDCTPRISICVCTFRRPGLLKQLLCDLGKLETVGITPEIQIIVADHDPPNSAKPVLESWKAIAPYSPPPLHMPVDNIYLATKDTDATATGKRISRKKKKS